MKTSSRPKFTLEKSVIQKQSDELKICMRKIYKGESYQTDSPFESKIIFGNHKTLST